VLEAKTNRIFDKSYLLIVKREDRLLKISNGIYDLQKIFNTVKSKYLLMNGNIEKNLKFFVGSCCEDLCESFSYVMDKKIESHEIDMIGFMNGEPIFATEFKCTFSYDRKSTINAAADASLKIKKTLEIKKLKKSEKQIVHFINHSKQDSDSSLNPDWIKEKYPKNRHLLSAVDLLKIYKKELSEYFQDHEIIPYSFGCPDLGLEALLVNVKDE